MPQIKETARRSRFCGRISKSPSVRGDKVENEGEIYRKTKELIKRYPEIEALYISWDGPAMEVIEALTELGRTDIVISTGDLDHAVAINMAKGGMIKVLSAQRPYEQGQAIALASVKSY